MSQSRNGKFDAPTVSVLQCQWKNILRQFFLITCSTYAENLLAAAKQFRKAVNLKLTIECFEVPKFFRLFTSVLIQFPIFTLKTFNCQQIGLQRNCKFIITIFAEKVK